MYVPVFGKDRHMYAIQIMKQKRLCGTWVEGIYSNRGGGGGGGVICDSKIVGRRLQDNIGYTVLKKGGGLAMLLLTLKNEIM